MIFYYYLDDWNFKSTVFQKLKKNLKKSFFIWKLFLQENTLKCRHISTMDMKIQSIIPTAYDSEILKVFFKEAIFRQTKWKKKENQQISTHLTISQDFDTIHWNSTVFFYIFSFIYIYALFCSHFLVFLYITHLNLSRLDMRIDTPQKKKWKHTRKEWKKWGKPIRKEKVWNKKRNDEKKRSNICLHQ